MHSLIINLRYYGTPYLKSQQEDIILRTYVVLSRVVSMFGPGRMSRATCTIYT